MPPPCDNCHDPVHRGRARESIVSEFMWWNNPPSFFLIKRLCKVTLDLCEENESLRTQVLNLETDRAYLYTIVAHLHAELYEEKAKNRDAQLQLHSLDDDLNAD